MTVAIVTPAYDGRVHDDHARSVDAGRAALAQAGLKSFRLCLTGDAVLPRVRNQCVAEALARGAERIVMIDSDIGFDPAVLVRLVSHDRDIVGAAPQAQLRSWRDAATPRCVWRPMPGDNRTEADGLVRAAGLATGFMSLRACVFRAMIEQGRAQRYIYPGIAPTAWPFLANYFWYALAPVKLTPEIEAQCREVGLEPDGVLHLQGEDYYFCDMARACGFECWLDAAIGVRHWEGRSKHDFSIAEMMALNTQSEAA